jgi:hypothetical protein
VRRLTVLKFSDAFKWSRASFCSLGYMRTSGPSNLVDPPVGPPPKHIGESLCGRACAVERAADPQHSSRIDAKPLGNLANAVSLWAIK